MLCQFCLSLWFLFHPLDAFGLLALPGLVCSLLGVWRRRGRACAWLGLAICLVVLVRWLVPEIPVPMAYANFMLRHHGLPTLPPDARHVQMAFDDFVSQTVYLRFRSPAGGACNMATGETFTISPGNPAGRIVPAGGRPRFFTPERIWEGKCRYGNPEAYEIVAVFYDARDRTAYFYYTNHSDDVLDGYWTWPAERPVGQTNGPVR